MADHPILFSAPMVRAILREIECPGTGKTQTRRFLDAWCDEPPAFVRDGVIMTLDCVDRPYRWPRTHAVGDRLLVGEAWRAEARYDHLPPRDIPVGSLVSYEADDDREPNDGCRGRLRRGRFLPFWARRLVAPVSAVRVERLLNISEADARAEGIRSDAWAIVVPWIDKPEMADAYPPNRTVYWAPDDDSDDLICLTAREAYGRLWDAINGELAFEANPWVAAYTFTVERRNIDAGGARG